MPLPYDNQDPHSILIYAKKLLNKTLREVQSSAVDQDTNLASKGMLGQAVEKYHFKYRPNNNPRPDFPNAGLELKVSPIKKLKNGDLVAKERMVLNIIDYFNEYKKDWENSSFWKKNKRLLIMFYLHQDDLLIYDLTFQLISIWDYPKEDLLIIKKDWEEIIKKIKDGKAHLISEGDTLYLGACTKGVGHGADLRNQPFSDSPAKQRAFSLKKNYVDIIIKTWTGTKKVDELEPIIKDVYEVEKARGFENYVLDKFQAYLGKTPIEIQNSIGANINPKAKNYLAVLTLRILGVNAKKAEEFEKADITIKTIRLKSNNMPKEDISFPYFKYKEIIKESWEDSTFKELLEKKFFFVIYKFDKNKELRLIKVVFWNMPIQDIDSYAKIVWETTVKRIIENNAENLPKKRENYACHVRPHGRNSKDTDETPNGTWLVKKCFWINGRYIRDQIIDSIEN